MGSRQKLQVRKREKFSALDFWFGLTTVTLMINELGGVAQFIVTDLSLGTPSPWVWPGVGGGLLGGMGRWSTPVPFLFLFSCFYV